MSRATEVAETLEQSKLMMSTAVREAAALLRQQDAVIKQCVEALNTAQEYIEAELNDKQDLYAKYQKMQYKYEPDQAALDANKAALAAAKGVL